MWSSLPCFCTFCCSAFPTSCYILNVFYDLFMSFFSSLSTCLSSGLPSHSSSLSQAATDIHVWTIDSGISYTGSIGWRITDPRILLNTESTLLWMDDIASSPWLCLKTGGTHRSRHSESMDNTSLNPFRYIHINDRDLPQSIQVPGSIDNTTHTWLNVLCFSIPPMPKYTAKLIINTDLISKSAILSNNFVSLLSDL